MSERYRYANVYAKNASEIPRGEHWAILTFGSVTIPGDERSRTNPGHGYPESTETTISYAAYLNEESFKIALEQELASPYSRVRGIHVTDTYSSKTVVSVDKESRP